MHDPMILVFGCRFFDVWHVDPEQDGSDDSCGWSYPKLTKKQRSIIEHLAYCESRTPWFQRDPVKRISSSADAESLLRGALQMVGRALRKELRWENICELACRLTHNSVDNFQSSLSHLSGWHTNFKEDLVSQRELCAKEFFDSIARIILREKRHWWQHPRWHFWHWKIVIHVILKLKRWVFSRCCKCGGKFKWHESPCTADRNSDGPRWFKGEKNVYHMNCEEHVVSSVNDCNGEPKMSE